MSKASEFVERVNKGEMPYQIFFGPGFSVTKQGHLAIQAEEPIYYDAAQAILLANWILETFQ